MALLGFFKYADFFVENLNALTGLAIPALQIPLPIGISFYTFQAMSYPVSYTHLDVYKRQWHNSRLAEFHAHRICCPKPPVRRGQYPAAVSYTHLDVYKRQAL